MPSSTLITPDANPLAVMNCRGKELSSTQYSYKLSGDNRYGLDVAFSDDVDINESQMSARIVYADGNRRDGVGDLLEVGGIKLERHRKNCIIGFDHFKKVDLPIAMALERDSDGKYDRSKYTNVIDPVSQQASVNAFFYQGKGMSGVASGKEYDHALLCEQYFHMMAVGMLRGGSIGYQVLKATQLQPDYERGTPQGLHLLSTLMLEASLVVLPANQDTIAKALSMPRMCGKPLSPYLVKSLEAFAPTRTRVVSGYQGKAMETPVPLDNLPDTKIPPVEWDAGAGAKSPSDFKSLGDDQDAIDSRNRLQRLQSDPNRVPEFVRGSEDRRIVEEHCSRELDAWRQAQIDHYSIQGIDNRLRNRRNFEQAFNNLKRAFEQAKRNSGKDIKSLRRKYKSQIAGDLNWLKEEQEETEYKSIKSIRAKYKAIPPVNPETIRTIIERTGSRVRKIEDMGNYYEIWINGPQKPALDSLRFQYGSSRANYAGMESLKVNKSLECNSEVKCQEGPNKGKPGRCPGSGKGPAKAPAASAPKAPTPKKVEAPKPKAEAKPKAEKKPSSPKKTEAPKAEPKKESSADKKTEQAVEKKPGMFRRLVSKLAGALGVGGKKEPKKESEKKEPKAKKGTPPKDIDSIKNQLKANKIDNAHVEDMGDHYRVRTGKYGDRDTGKHALSVLKTAFGDHADWGMDGLRIDKKSLESEEKATSRFNTDPKHFNVGDRVIARQYIARGSGDTFLRSGERATVTDIDPSNFRITVRRDDGEEHTTTTSYFRKNLKSLDKEEKGNNFKEHDEGWDAAASGKPRTACPYPSGSSQYRSWTEGWRDYKEYTNRIGKSADEIDKEEKSADNPTDGELIERGQSATRYLPNQFGGWIAFRAGQALKKRGGVSMQVFRTAKEALDAADRSMIGLTHHGKPMKDGDEIESEEKSLHPLRKKYRTGKGLRRRLRKSVPGTSLVHVDSKDLQEAEEMATAKGLKWYKMGTTSNGTEKVKLVGDDDAIDEIAKCFGQPMGVKFLLDGSVQTKAIDGNSSKSIKSIRQKYKR